MEFLNSLKKRLKHYNSPFDHWELNEPLTEEAIEEICKTEIVDLTKMILIMMERELLMVVRVNLEKEYLMEEKQ